MRVDCTGFKAADAVYPRRAYLRLRMVNRRTGTWMTLRRNPEKGPKIHHEARRRRKLRL